LLAEARDGDGPCTVCSGATRIVTAAALRNPCETEVSFTTSSSCFVNEWHLTDGVTVSDYIPDCEQAVTTWMVGPGQQIEDTHDWGIVPVGSHTVTVEFHLPGGALTQYSFDVQ